MTVDQVRASGRRALVGKRPMTRVGRAVEKGETQGFMKVVVDAETQEILGAAIFGVGGDEAIHAILDVMSAKAPYTTLARTMHIHPTVSELVPTMLQEMAPLAGTGRHHQTSALRWRGDGSGVARCAPPSNRGGNRGRRGPRAATGTAAMVSGRGLAGQVVNDGEAAVTCWGRRGWPPCASSIRCRGVARAARW